MKYFTKSKFRLALNCVTQLYYSGREEYADNSLNDPFLKALADGGYQVGELAKYLFSENPESDGIKVDTLDYDEALRTTEEKLKSNENAVIAEAAFSYDKLFVRVDLVKRSGKVIHLYEVKSKSVDDQPLDFITSRGEKKIKSEWVSTLYDIAFQKYVASQSEVLRDFIIIPHLILVDKTKICTTDRMNQIFRITRDDRDKVKVIIKPGTTAADLDTDILRDINVSVEADKIIDEYPVPTDVGENYSFRAFVDYTAGLFIDDKREFTPLGGKKCKACSFNNRRPDLSRLKSGFTECWQHHTGLPEEELKEGLVTELWGGLAGSRNLTDELIKEGIYKLRDVKEQHIAPKEVKETTGLSPLQRRMEQVNRVKNDVEKSYFDKEGFLEEAAGWTYPLHMIDFETSMPAIPFTQGRRPYEGIAFQFSHHVIEQDGSIRHEGQYLSFEKGFFPNYEFVRELKKQLSADEGTIFRYHNHENSYLSMIYDQLETDPAPPADKTDLQQFIRLITNYKDGRNRIAGSRDMQDLYQVIIKYYYSPYAKGENSIKKILPAIIKDSEYLREKYSRPVYGSTGGVPSLNFKEHVWIDPLKDPDPYKTLPKLFSEYDDELLDRLTLSLGEVADGGAAMTAYGYLQYSDISAEMKEELKNGLLRYCELDTMAMVMLVEGLMSKCEAK